MSGQSPEDYRKRQREFYQSNAVGWDVWAASVAEQSEGFNNPLIEAAGVAEGMKILDLASGAGEPALPMRTRPRRPVAAQSPRLRPASYPRPIAP